MANSRRIHPNLVQSFPALLFRKWNVDTLVELSTKMFKRDIESWLVDALAFKWIHIMTRCRRATRK